MGGRDTKLGYRNWPRSTGNRTPREKKKVRSKWIKRMVRGKRKDRDYSRQVP